MPQPDPATPDRLDDLLQGEHMVLWAFRAIAMGAADCRLIRKQFDLACGPTGAEALAALNVFVRELGLNGRRKVTLAAPGSACLTRDEQLVLAVFAAAQAEDYGRLEAHLAWLLADTPRRPFAAAACMTAQALAMNGFLLRLPSTETGISTAPESDAAAAESQVVTPFRRRAS